MPNPITLKDRGGRLFDYDTPEDAQHAIQNLGYAPATSQEVVTYDSAKKEREEFGNTAAQALALGELALGSASFGVLSPDSPEAEARRRQLRKQSPFLAMGAEAAGAAVPGLLTAGAGSAIAGAGRLARVGTALASDFAGGLSLEAEQADEEKRRMDVGNVAMWSLGGVMAESLVRSGFKTASNFKNNVIPSALTKAQDFRSGGAFKAGAELTDLETKRYVQNWDEIVNHTRTLGRDSGNSFLESFDAAHSVSYKADDIRGLVKTNQRAQRKFLDDTVGRAEVLADALDARGAKKTAATVRRHIFELESATDAADLNVAGDQLKRSADRFRKKAAAAARQSGNDPFNDLVSEFDAVSNPLRKDLEDAKTWGADVAGKQKAENLQWSDKKKGFIHNNAIFQDAFYSRMPGSTATDFDGLPQFMWDDDKLLAFMNKDRIGQKEVLDAGENMLASVDEMIKIKEGLGIRPADMIQLKTDAADLRATLSEIQNLAQAKVKGADLIERMKSKAGGELRKNVVTTAGGLAGAAVGGPLGAVLGAGVARQMDDFFSPVTIRNLDPLVTRDVARDSLAGKLSNLSKAAAPTNPATAAGVPTMTATALRQAAEHTGAQLMHETNAEDMSELSEHGRAWTEKAAQTLASGGPRPPRLPDAPTRFQGNFAALTDAFNSRKEFLVQVSADPTVLMKHLADSYGELPETHPGMFAQIATRAMSGVVYLTENLPPSIGYSLRDPSGLPASQDAMRDFARLWDAVFEPADTLHDVATGRATPQQMRALAAVHPDVFAQFQAQVINKMSARLKPPPYESQRYLDQVMQLNGAYSPAFSIAVARNIKNAMASAPANPEGLKSGKLETGPTNPRGIASIAAGPTSGGI